MQYAINSIRSTANLAKGFAAKLKPASVLFLEGDVGSGKSTFVRFLLKALGVDYMGSPTFGIVNQYKSIYKDDYKGSDVDIIHADFYRDSDNILQNLSEYGDAIFIIEWASLNQEILFLFPNPIILTFSFEGNKYRTCECQY